MNVRIHLFDLCIEMNNANKDYNRNSAKKKKNGAGRKGGKGGEAETADYSSTSQGANTSM